jgi:arginyl-tRNA synthetase
MSISKIQNYEGRDVSKIILVNDRGIHICKSMLAWQKFGNGETPESTGLKGDHFVGKYYIRFAIESEKNPTLNDEAQVMLQKWEAGDKEVVELWEKMNKWVYDGFDQTYNTFVFEFDKYYYESQTYKLGKDIILDGLKKGVFKKGEEESIYFELPEDEFGLDENKDKKKVILIRKDGTTVYITQDIGTAIARFADYKFDKMIYVVGSEQRYHFQCLVSILKALGYAWAENIFHFSYGMVYLPEGKMKSREGKVVDADNFYEEMFNLAKEAVLEKHSELEKLEIEKRARIIALGAIKFYILRVGAEQDINFDPNESISFNGFTGPYCQYAYARIAGILRKAELENIKYKDCDYSLLGNPEERLLLQKIVLLNEKVSDSAESLSPSTLAVHIYETAKAFNQFYHKHQIVGIDSDNLARARLKLISQVALVLKESLDLLGIDVLESM